MKTLDEESRQALSVLADLIHVVDRKVDSEGIAQSMLDHVGILRSVYEMEKYDLMKQEGMTNVLAYALDIVDDMRRFMDLEAFPPHMSARTFALAAPYFSALMKSRRVEYCYMMCVGRTGRMISCPLMQRGTIDESAVYVRELAYKAMIEKAKYAILAHNHPGGTTIPSPADMQVTVDAIVALRAVNVALLDHIIVTDRQAVSIRAIGQPRESFWIKGWENDKILKGWAKK